MELELGLKLTRAVDDFNSEFQFAKDRTGPLFLSQEIDAMFILTAHLKGYKRGNIKIDINEDGTLIAISGERRVKETVMVGWKVHKKGAEVKGFKKVFRIPDGVILDKIKAKFNEDESTLTITMPKKVKGIRGTAIEEIKEKQELDREESGNLQIVEEGIQTTGTSTSQENDEKLKARDEEDDITSETHIVECGKKMPEEEKPVEDVQKVHDSKDGEKGQENLPSVQKEVPHEETEMPKVAEDIQNIPKPRQDQELDKNQVLPDKTNDIHEEGEKSEEEKQGPIAVEPPEGSTGRGQEGEQRPREKRCKMCIPIVAGSTILLSFVVFVIQMIRTKNQISRRKD